jgi:eukaryotic-like serine/threonine-protein kinase
VRVVGETIAGRYRLEELIGSGGMARVFRAHDTLLERDVALKILDERFLGDAEYVERFRREARAAAQLSHPNIVTVIDRGEEDGHQYIVFEYVEGETLKQLIERTGPLPVAEAIELALQVGRALAFAHTFGLVHRDVKPQNVLLNGDGAAKVTDFGIARTLDVEKGVTQTGTVLGTSNYIAPEQASGERVDEHSDVYSLGVVLYELLTGEVPFPGDSFVAVAMRHINEPAPDVRERRPDVPPRLAAAIDRALEKDPADRFEMDELVGELEACLAGLEGGDEDATVVVRPSRKRRPAKPGASRRRRPIPWPVVVGVLALAPVIGAGLALYFASDGTEEGQAASARIELRGVTSYDPEGDDRQEHNEAVANATDGDLGTYWPTQTYRTFAKSGVGLVLDAGEEASPKTITVRTSTPGFTAVIRAGSTQEGPFSTASSPRSVGVSTAFELHDVKARYFVVWITSLPSGVARITEVTARA